MPGELSARMVRLLRLRAQDLDGLPSRAIAPRRPESGGEASGAAGSVRRVEQVAERMVGLQAQFERAAALSVRARAPGVVEADVERARVETRSVVRTWCHRGTLHLVAARDLPWLLSLIGPFHARADARKRTLGLDEATLAKGSALLRRVLGAQAPLTRAQIAERLASRGLRLEGQAVPHLLAYAALRGLLCCGPDVSGDPSYVLLEDWIPGRVGGWTDIHPGERQPQGARAAALRELARRYVLAHGPCTPEDLAAWSGLPRRDARSAWAGIETELVEFRAAGGSLWLHHRHLPALRQMEAARGAPPSGHGTAETVRLIAGYDPYLLGYASRALVVAPENARRIHPGGGTLHPALLVEGFVQGTWQLRQRGAGAELAVRPFADLGQEVWRAVDGEAADVGRFFGQPVTLRPEERGQRGH
jgi:hypothetical protein